MTDETEEVKPLDARELIWGVDHISSYKILIDRINWLTQKVQELEKKGAKDGN